MALLLLLLIIPAEGHNLLPFGNSIGDHVVQRVDDGSSDPLILNQPFIFFGRSYNQIIINTNGIVSFNEGFPAFRPSKFPCGNRLSDCNIPALIAPFWHDFDLRQGGNIYYRQTSDAYVIQSLHTMLLNNTSSLNSIIITNIIIATWDRVPPFGRLSSYPVHNTLQVVLAGDGTSVSYVVFIYDDIQWGEGALIGFNAGDGTVYFTIPGALSSATLNICQMSNVGSPGLFIYKVDGIECNDTENAGIDNEYNCTLYQHSCPEDSFHTDICGSIKLRIESELSSESVLDTKYNASIFITVTEWLGITNFKDINLILSLTAQEKAVMGSEVEITDGLGVSLPKFIIVSKNDIMAELNLSITRMDPSPTTLLLKIESASKQACFENGSDIKIKLPGASQASFQLKLLHVGNCLDWTAMHSAEEISSVVAEEIESSCLCDFTTDNIINAKLVCNDHENAHVIMRAQISYNGIIRANEFVNIISMWIRNTPNLTINETVVTIDPRCPVKVNVLTPNDCFREVQHETASILKLHILEISSSAAACLIIIGGLLIVTCTCCHHKRNCQRKATGPKCVPLPIKIDHHFNKEQNNIEEGYATVSVVRGVDIIPVTSNEAYGRWLQSQMLTHHDQDIIYEEITAQDYHNDAAYDESAIYDIPL